MEKITNLKYLEIHLTDHCNFNCMGCGHFAPISPPWFVSIESFTNDMDRLSKLFNSIEKIRLMGGEPLLHKNIADFPKITRDKFPNSNIVIVTNGALLHKMKKDFWENCTNNKTTIQVSLYPELKNPDQLNNLVDKYNNIVKINKVEKFFAYMNPKGDSDPVEAMNYCRSRYYCPLLRAGKIYLCPFTARMPAYRDRFNIPIPDGGALDIYTEELTGEKIIKFLDTPAKTCKFCACAHRDFDWKETTKGKEEWWI